MIIKCPECEKEFDKQVKFCTQCGHHFIYDDTPEMTSKEPMITEQKPMIEDEFLPPPVKDKSEKTESAKAINNEKASESFNKNPKKTSDPYADLFNKNKNKNNSNNGNNTQQKKSKENTYCTNNQTKKEETKIPEVKSIFDFEKIKEDEKKSPEKSDNACSENEKNDIKNDKKSFNQPNKTEEKIEIEECMTDKHQKNKAKNNDNEANIVIYTDKSENNQTISYQNLEDITSYIKSIDIDEISRVNLYPFVYENVRGYKGCFISEQGTNKENVIKEIGKILYKLKKIKKSEPEHLSFNDIPLDYDSDILYVIEDLGIPTARLFDLNDYTEDSTKATAIMKEKLEALLRAKDSSYIIITGTEIDCKGFFTLDPRISFKFDKKVIFRDLTSEEIVQKTIEFLPIYHQKQVTDEYKSQLGSFIESSRKNYPFNNAEFAKYLAEFGSRQEKLIVPEDVHKNFNVDKAFENIIGMEDVKMQVKELHQFLIMRKKLEKMGMVLPPINLHMMFLGPAGVGKTTVARIIAKILFDEGYVDQDKLIEVTSKDLVSSYANQTGAKTNRIIRNAMGGVLFIDEAYSLSNSCGPAGEEAIATLIKYMEDYKGKFSVMFAGYSIEMGQFVDSNSGIKSRIPYTFTIRDYTPEQLLEMYVLKMSKIGFKINDTALPKLKTLIDNGRRIKNFGNGRFIDKLIQRTMTKQSTLNLNGRDMIVITDKSIPDIGDIVRNMD